MTGFSQEVGHWGGFGSETGADEARSDRGAGAWPPGAGGNHNHCDGAGERLAKLVRALEAEVIPRLALARRGAPAVPGAAAGVAPGEAAVAEFTTLILAQDAAVAATYVETLRARGASLETVFLDLLAPSARRLGELWKADRCDFAAVTIGLWRLHQLLRELGPTFRNEAEYRPLGRRVLLAPSPGEQHMFGISMVAEFFRRAGWDVAGGPTAKPADLVGMVRSERYEVVGLSLSGTARLDGLAAGIRDLRRASRNRALRVMVGGQAFNERPELVALVGADATAPDARVAPEQAKHLLKLLSRA